MRLDPADNVAVSVAEAGLDAGAPVGTDGVHTRSAVPRGHKVALEAIARGAAVRKYGHPIGVATADIAAGEHVHVHNVAMPPAELLQAHYAGAAARPHGRYTDTPARTFRGYLRPSGRAGTRNVVCVVATVNCSATVVKAVCRAFEGEDLGARGIDRIVPIAHAAGCAQAIGGLGYTVLNRTLAGWIYHPNVVGAVVIGLGCEGTTFASILASRRASGVDDIPVHTLGIQESGGTAAAIAAGIASVRALLDALPPFERTDVPIERLNLALNCGGSDGFSGLTANPALGMVSDRLVAQRATVSLAEIPECHGAEGLLAARCVDDSVRAALSQTFAWWADYAGRHRVELNDNLAPGNIAGGITTIVEKSLGAVAKGGTSPLVEVVDYAAPITRSGFVLMNTPGFDPVSVTGLVAGGANIVAFTTGRGSVYGCAIAPTIKIATNSTLFARMSGDMDIDAGRALADGTLDPVADALFEYVIAVASGERTASERLGVGGEEFVPWAIGETL